jgi:hypothetical protein
VPSHEKWHQQNVKGSISSFQFVAGFCGNIMPVKLSGETFMQVLLIENL